jgi:hypothetical protein
LPVALPGDRTWLVQSGSYTFPLGVVLIVMLLEGKEMRTFISTNGGKTGFSGNMGDWVGGKGTNILDTQSLICYSYLHESA